MKAAVVSMCVLVSIVWISPLFADDNTCWLSAGQEDDVWVIVYDENDEGTRGGVIWQGKIPAGEKVMVRSAVGHIRYSYKMDPNEGYEGDFSVDCDQQATILVD